MECPGSIQLESLFPEETSEYAEEGTLAHALAEALLRNAIYGGDPSDIEEQFKDAPREMWDYVGDYVDYCLEIYQESKLQYADTQAFVEERIDYSRYAPEGFGTADFICIGGPVLNVVDLKYGKGVPVKAPGNPQTRLYGLGAVDFYHGIYTLKIVRMHIFQPRINCFSVERMTRKALVEWGRSDVVDKAAEAYGSCGKRVPGDHCRFCRARGACKERAASAINTIASILGGIQNAKSKNKRDPGKDLRGQSGNGQANASGSARPNQPGSAVTRPDRKAAASSRKHHRMG
jgi:hypothetical protein